jgi:hypothetical protein
MSYTIMMSRLDESKTNKIEWGNSVAGTDLRFDDTKTWTNLFDYVILYKHGKGDWDFLIGYNEKYSSGETISPDHSQ